MGMQVGAHAGDPTGSAILAAMTARVDCVGAVITDPGGRLLLVRRGHDPGAGLWSLPGGRVEAGESDEQAVAREVLEECGLRIACGALLGSVERPGLDGTALIIRDYRAVITGGQLRAGDDATAACWAGAAALAGMAASGQLTSGLVEALASWSALPWP